MTTLVYRDGILAADRLVSEGSNFVSYEKKIFKVAGNLVGFVGDTSAQEPLKKFIKEKFDEALLKKVVDSSLQFGMVVIPASGRYYYKYGSEFGVFRDTYKKSQFFADGTGSDIALGALQAGASAEEAVQVAIQLDLYSGGKVDTLCH